MTGSKMILPTKMERLIADIWQFQRDSLAERDALRREREIDRAKFNFSLQFCELARIFYEMSPAQVKNEEDAWEELDKLIAKKAKFPAMIHGYLCEPFSVFVFCKLSVKNAIRFVP